MPKEREWRAGPQKPGASHAPEQRTKSELPITPKPQPKKHMHRWQDSIGLSGREWYCLHCGATKKGVREAKGVTSFDQFMHRCFTGARRINGRGEFMETVGDNGGFAGYDRATELITTGDGTTITLEALFTANPKLTEAERTRIIRELEQIAKEQAFKKATAGLAVMGSSASASADSLKKVGEQLASMASWVSGDIIPDTDDYQRGYEAGKRATKLNSDGALKLIIEEIKHSKDPFVTGGEWLSRITNEITTVIRESEDRE